MTLPQKFETVRVRGRNWIVTSVGNSNRSTGISVGRGDTRNFTLVKLLSVDDFGKQEEISVIWEIEVGAEILSSATLPRPNKFDPPETMDAFVLALKWGAIASLDSKALQSPFRSGITIEPYQLEPVLRALEMPRVNLLIADDVGLGKTIEAGLVIQEMILRHRARKVMIVCPSPLTIKWYEEMLDKFGLEFEIVNSTSLKELRRTRGLNANPFKIFPRTIVSMDWAKTNRAKRLLDDVMSPSNTPFPREFDILVVDEVHHFAPKAATENYAIATARTQLLQRIAPHFEHRLFLSATPHNGHQFSFRSLLALLDPQRFTASIEPSEEAKQEVMVRRIKSDIVDDKGKRRYPERKVSALEVSYKQTDLEAQEILDRYIESRREDNRNRSGEKAAELVLILLKKRLYSSPLAFKNTLDKHIEAISKGTRNSNLDVREEDITSIFDDEYDNYGNDDIEPEESESDSLVKASSIFGPASEEQGELLSHLSKWAEKNQSKADAKAEAVIRWIKEICLNGGENISSGWNNERVILFTEYRDTQDYLYELLQRRGLAGDRLALLNGSTDEESREMIKGQFQRDPKKYPLRIILATDAASEGIDLQRYCHRMLHVEIPFSPIKLEQRIGRIDRHGQQSPVVEIFHFVTAGWDESTIDKSEKWSRQESDTGFLSLMAAKIATIEGDLGAISTMLSSELCNILLNRPARKELFKSEKRHTASSSNSRLVNAQRTNKAGELLKSSIAELRVEPENVIRATQTALELANQPKLLPRSLDREKGAYIRAYEVPQFTRTWAKAVTGLVDPLTGENRLLVFDSRDLDSRGDLLYAHLNSPLVSQALSALRSNIWQSESNASISRVSARYLDRSFEGQDSRDYYVITHGRHVVFGNDGSRIHEEIISAGGRVRDGSFRRFDSLNEMETVLAQATFDDASSEHGRKITDQWERVQQSVFDALETRRKDRFSSITNLISKRSAEEINQVTEILNDLGRTLKLAVAEFDKDKQIAMFTEDLKLEREKDLRIVQDRIANIPREIEQEKEAISARYRDPFSKVFPAAVEFLVPRKIQW